MGVTDGTQGVPLRRSDLLTERMVQVIELRADGHTRQQIARDLGISDKRVWELEMHARRRLQLSLRARRDGVAGQDVLRQLGELGL